MFGQSWTLLFFFALLGQQPVPLSARGGFMSDAQYDQWAALQERIQELESRKQQEIRQNRDTSLIDSELSQLQIELSGLTHENESYRPFIPAVKEFIGEVDGFVTGLDPVSEMTVEQADQLADFLYRDLGHLSANYRGSMDVLMHIRSLVELPSLPPGVKTHLNARLMKFHQEGGGHSAPEVMAYLGESLYLTSTPQHPSRQGALDLMNNAQQWFAMVGEYRDQQDFLLSNQFVQELRDTEERIGALTAKEDISASELSDLSAAVLKSTSARPNERSLEVLLREYRRLLRKPKLRTEVASLIEADLIKMAQLPLTKDNPNWKHWKLWAETGSLLAKRGGNLKEFAAKELDRLRSAKASRKTSQLKAMSYVQERCS